MAIKYKWLTEQLRDLIQEYIQNARNRLPAEQELCARYRVSRQTVRAALAVLEESQEIRRIKGSGSYITGLSDQESRNVIGVLQSFPHLRSSGSGTADSPVSPEKSSSCHSCRTCKKRAAHSQHRALSDASSKGNCRLFPGLCLPWPFTGSGSFRQSGLRSQPAGTGSGCQRPYLHCRHFPDG